MDEKDTKYESSSLELPRESTEVLATPPSASSNDPGKRKSTVSRKTLIKVVGSLLVFIFILFLASSFFVKREVEKIKQPVPVTINTQSLDNGTLNKLTVQAGPENQTTQQLTIEPETLFKSSVEVQGSLKAQGDLEVGGNLNVRGTTTLQGAVGINSNLAVRGSLSVGGTLTAPSLNIGNLGATNINASGSLSFGGHLIPSGSVPSAKPSLAASGGTVTISGNDTAGTVTITIGGGAVQTSEMAIITFATRFTTTPKVQLTPINAAASALNYYATRNAGFFTIETSTVPSNGAQYVFDYLVTQ